MPQIPCDRIDATDRREESEGLLPRMMDSLRQNGQLHPIFVTQSPTAPGRYVMLAGRRRLAAAQRLGWKQIEARVMTAGDIRNELVMIAENVDRLELTAVERDISIARYAELVRQLRAQEAIQPPESKNCAGPAQLKTPRDAGNRRRQEGSVTRKVAETFSVAPRTAQVALRRADALSDEDRRMLDLRGVRDARLDRLVAIPDPERRALVIEAIGEGVAYTDAMAGILGQEFKRGEDDLSPVEWLATLPLAAKAVNQQRFRSDALLYRKIQRAKIGLADDVDWARIKGEHDAQGIFFRRLLFLLDCPHPRSWIVCGGCTAGVQGGRDHLACRGGGYILS